MMKESKVTRKLVGLGRYSVVYWMTFLEILELSVAIFAFGGYGLLFMIFKNNHGNNLEEYFITSNSF